MKLLQGGSFLARLARDTRGNTLALMAAAFFPLAGLIGGGVDMSRIYITKTRLQQACDAGALSGRKAMGSGSWTTTTGGTRDRAYQLFDANFKQGDFGTGTRLREFTQNDGTVTGTASAVVPMTIMKIFRMPTFTASVTCTAKMEIPNTDVMFVLDLTASMNCAVTSPSCDYQAPNQVATNARVVGLRKAVKCFYEALLKVNTTEVCNPAYTDDDGVFHPAAEATATSYSGTAQIRIGFVPYAVNVNVGKLLPHAYMADNVTYTTRQAVVNPVTHTWTPGTPDTPTNWTNWSGSPLAVLGDDAQYSTTWQVVTGADSDTFEMQTGSSFRKKYNTLPLPTDAASCAAKNTYGTQKELVGFQWTDGTAGTTSYTPSVAPVWSATPPQTQDVNASRSRTETVTYGYRYKWQKNPTNATTSACWLERAQKTNTNKTFTQTQSATTTRPIMWADYEEFTRWDYNELSLPVGGLKVGTSGWASSVSIPRLTTSTVSSVYRSGSNTMVNLTIPAARTVAWDGCIEELPTHRSDADPSDDYDTLPADAKDLVIDHIPLATDPDDNKWAPLLNPGAPSNSVYFGRYTGTNTKSYAAILNTTADLSQNLAPDALYKGYFCPNPARRLRAYYEPDTADAVTGESGFVSYVNTFVAEGIGTYHDIGLLWGARLLSPTGIFKADNALTGNGGAIERHMIFMTDGDSRAFDNNLYAYGAPWFARQQTPTNTAPTSDALTAQINPRTELLCTLIKNMNIKLWVISYGGGADSNTEDMLEDCASPDQYFAAEDDEDLRERFQQIASEIADLRLTN